jgi:hypothetical protein
MCVNKKFTMWSVFNISRNVNITCAVYTIFACDAFKITSATVGDSLLIIAYLELQSEARELPKHTRSQGGRLYDRKTVHLGPSTWPAYVDPWHEEASVWNVAWLVRKRGSPTFTLQCLQQFYISVKRCKLNSPQKRVLKFSHVCYCA